MNTIDIFNLGVEGYSMRRLDIAEDKDALQKLFEKNVEYAEIVEGEAVAPNAAEDCFLSGPPGKSLENKFVFGLTDPQGGLVGVLEGMAHYPKKDVWWIGLLMLAPELHGQGMGRRLILAFNNYVFLHGGDAIMLGVVEDNRRAYDFWQANGFKLERKTEARPFGKKNQAVYVMRLDLEDSEGGIFWE